MSGGGATAEVEAKAPDERERERELRRAFPLRACVLDASSLTILFVSQALGELLGLADPRAMSFEETIVAEDRGAVLEASRDVAATGAPRALEYRAVGADGSFIDVAAELRPLRWTAGGSVSEIAATIVERPRDRRDGGAAPTPAGDAFDAYPDGLVSTRADGTIARWNEPFAQLWEAPADLRDPEVMLRLAAAQLEDPSALLDELPGVPRTESNVRMRCADGRIIERSVRALPSGWLWIFRDVSKQARMEEAMLTSEVRYLDLYNKTPVMMHSIDRTGHLVSVSDEWLRKLGYEREEVLGRPSVDFLTPESRRYALDTVLPEFFRTGVCVDVPYRFKKKNGEVVDVLLSGIAERDPDGSHRRSLAVLIDVTQRLRAEAQRDQLLVQERRARESAESALALLDTLFRTAPVGLAFLDRDLCYVRVNEALARQFHGAAPEVSLGRTIWETVPSVAHAVAPIVLRVIETGQPATNVEIVGELPSTSGELHSLLVSYYPVLNATKEVSGVGVIAIDNTEQKRAATLQARLFREAREAVRVRDDFLATVAHELRTPMTPLVIYLQMLQETHGDDPAERGMIEKTLQQVEKLRALVDDMLDSARVESGDLALGRDRVSLAPIVTSGVERARAASPRHIVELDMTPEEVFVVGDPFRLSQVLSNLLENAAKYSRAGTRIRVSLARRDGEVVLSVADEGIGVPADELPKLFNRFFRARNAPVSQYGGLGLGLYICRNIVEQHGGRIWAESDAGTGSTFRVALPTVP